MNAVNPPDSIDVNAVRIGMFVHLDVGWMSHPFPLSSFKVTTPEQLAQLRSLGMTRVRWSPQQSDFGGLPAPQPGTGVDDAAPDPTLAPAQQARAEHRRRLADQRAALMLAERQFAEAARDCRRLTDLVPTKPAEARSQAEALSGALLGKMLVDNEVCIRLLTDAAGDKAATHALNVTIMVGLLVRARRRFAFA